MLMRFRIASTPFVWLYINAGRFWFHPLGQKALSLHLSMSVIFSSLLLVYSSSSSSPPVPSVPVPWSQRQREKWIVLFRVCKSERRVPWSLMCSDRVFWMLWALVWWAVRVSCSSGLSLCSCPCCGLLTIIFVCC